MQEDVIKINHFEALKHLEGLKLKATALEEELRIVNYDIGVVDVIIRNNDEKDQNWIVEVPTKLLRKSTVENLGCRINWKAITMELFAKYQFPMNTELLLNKAILNYKQVPADRDFVLKNLSAALHYLVFKDLKLFRVKGNIRNRGFIYGLKNFFATNGEIKPEYFKKYEMELGTKN